MRYLYGDLSKARCQDDTLGLLQRVIDMAVEVLKLHAQTDALLLGIQEEKTRLTSAVEDIDRFQDELRQTIQNSFSNRPQGHVVVDIGEAVTTTLQQHTKDGKARLSTQAEERIRSLQGQLQQLGSATFEALRRFYLASPLPATTGTLRASLDGLGYRADAEVVDVTGLRCCYTLDTSRSEFFSGAKRFGELVPGKLEIPIGTKKGWMKKEPVPELVRIEDAMVTEVADTEKLGEYRLSVRAGSGALSLVVRVAKQPAVGCRVYRNADPEPNQPVPPELFTSAQTEALIRFWNQVEPQLQLLSNARDNLTKVYLDNLDVLASRLYTQVIGKLVGYLTPVVREIDAHSVLPGELSLTLERDEEGKREVFFVRKDKLLARINELPESHRKLFAPLGLDRNLAASVIVETPAAPTAAPPATTPTAPPVKPAPAPNPLDGLFEPAGPDQQVEFTDEAVSTEVVKGVLLKDNADPKKPGPRRP